MSELVTPGGEIEEGPTYQSISIEVERGDAKTRQCPAVSS